MVILLGDAYMSLSALSSDTIMIFTMAYRISNNVTAFRYIEKRNGPRLAERAVHRAKFFHWKIAEFKDFRSMMIWYQNISHNIYVTRS